MRPGFRLKMATIMLYKDNCTSTIAEAGHVLRNSSEKHEVEAQSESSGCISVGLQLKAKQSDISVSRRTR